MTVFLLCISASLCVLWESFSKILHVCLASIEQSRNRVKQLVDVQHQNKRHWTAPSWQKESITGMSRKFSTYSKELNTCTYSEQKYFFTASCGNMNLKSCHPSHRSRLVKTSYIYKSRVSVSGRLLRCSPIEDKLASTLQLGCIQAH